MKLLLFLCEAVMKLLLFLLLLLSLYTGPGTALSIRRPMWNICEPKSWAQAQQHCREEFGGDLLTAVSQGELDQMDLSSFYAWVGMRSHGDHHHWEDPGDEHVAEGWEPIDRDDTDDCALVYYRTDKTFGASCSEHHFFFCTGAEPDGFVPRTKSKSDAQNYCMNMNQRLSTFPDQNGPQWPGSPLYVAREFPVWIGLHSNGGSWKWSDQNHSDFRNWAPELDPPGASDCVAVSSGSKSMSVQSCSEAFPFLCYKHNMVLVKELLTWEQAVDTCRNLSSTPTPFGLLRVQQNQIDIINNALRFTTTTKVWVGLRFLGGSWFWADGGAVSLSLPQCPESELHCGALVLNRTSGPDLIEPSDCSQRFNVLCYREP